MGRLVILNVMLASADQGAIDAVSAKMMGFDPMSLQYIRLAHEDGLGIGDPRDIEIVGDPDAAQENWKFHVGKNLVRIGGGDLIWFGPLKRFQKLFFHTPLVNGFILASDVYHDFYRWPLVDPNPLDSRLPLSGGRMNYARLALAAVAATVFDACYGFLVYGVMLAPEFARYPGVYRSNEAGQASM